jgi:hypothetical protein
LNIFVTASGLTDPTGTTTLLSSLTSQTLPAGWSVTASTWLDLGNGIFTEVTALGSDTFNAIGASVQSAVETLTGTYSLTEVHHHSDWGRQREFDDQHFQHAGTWDVAAVRQRSGRFLGLETEAQEPSRGLGLDR